MKDQESNSSAFVFPSHWWKMSLQQQLTTSDIMRVPHVHAQRLVFFICRLWRPLVGEPCTFVSGDIHAWWWTLTWGIKVSVTVREAPVLKRKGSQIVVRGSNYGHIPKATHGVVQPLCKPSICTQLKLSRLQPLWIFESLAWGAERRWHFLLGVQWPGTPSGKRTFYKSNLQSLLVPLAKTKHECWTLLHVATTGSGAFLLQITGSRNRETKCLFWQSWIQVNGRLTACQHVDLHTSHERQKGVWVSIFRSKQRLFLLHISQTAAKCFTTDRNI